MTDAFSSLTSAFQIVAGTSPKINFGLASIDIIPSAQGVSPMFVDGGTGDGGEVTVQTLASAWGGSSPAPVKLDVVTVTGMASGPDKTYQVLDSDYREGTLTFILGNLDAQ